MQFCSVFIVFYDSCSLSISVLCREISLLHGWSFIKVKVHACVATCCTLYPDMCKHRNYFYRLRWKELIVS